MNLAANIQVNLQIMKLIKSKYAEETFPAGLKTIEAKYYTGLQTEMEKARLALANDGLVKNVDSDAEQA